MLFLVHAL